ncbi:hypothetical protein BJ742DRAFT_859756 [Cladochytrium replicatum]|nr:hypothetical protein BJ742DRAFT_859756 [Cladochytrium replicatum]
MADEKRAIAGSQNPFESPLDRPGSSQQIPPSRPSSSTDQPQNPFASPEDVLASPAPAIEAPPAYTLGRSSALSTLSSSQNAVVVSDSILMAPPPIAEQSHTPFNSPPRYTIAIGERFQLPQFVDKNMKQARRPRKLLIMAVLCAIPVIIFSVIVAAVMMRPGSSPNAAGNGNGNGTNVPTGLNLKQLNSYTFAGAKLPTDTGRHVTASDSFAVATLDSVASLNGASALGGVSFTGDKVWLQEIEPGVKITHLTHYVNNTFIAVNTTSAGVCIVLLNLDGSSGKLIAFKSLNITRTFPQDFRRPVINTSIYLTKKYAEHTLYVAMADSGSTTYIKRMDVPGLEIDAESIIKPNNLGYYRFAETVGNADMASINLNSAILMLPSVAPSIAERSIAYFIPNALDVVFPALTPPSPFRFLGAPFRASSAPNLAGIIVMGDKAAIAADATSASSSPHEYMIYPAAINDTFSWYYGQQSYRNEKLNEVVLHSSGKWTLEGFEDHVLLKEFVDKTTAAGSASRPVYRFATDYAVESIASSGSSSVFVVGVKGSSVVVSILNVESP